jgi:hypothetical protein
LGVVVACMAKDYYPNLRLLGSHITSDNPGAT